jgi:hypothetical protein
MIDEKELYEFLMRTREGRRLCCTECGTSYCFDNLYMCKRCGSVYCHKCYWEAPGVKRRCPCGGELV